MTARGRHQRNLADAWILMKFECVVFELDEANALVKRLTH